MNARYGKRKRSSRETKKKVKAERYVFLCRDSRRSIWAYVDDNGVHLYVYRPSYLLDCIDELTSVHLFLKDRASDFPPRFALLSIENFDSKRHDS